MEVCGRGAVYMPPMGGILDGEPLFLSPSDCDDCAQFAERLEALEARPIAKEYTAGAGISITPAGVIATNNPNTTWTNVSDKPVFNPVATSGNYNDLTNKPDLKPVATSGSYNDLTNKPDLKPVATSGSYNDLTDKPTIPPAYDDSALSGRVSSLESGKQDKMSAGTGISISGANQISAERHAGNTYTKEEVNNLIPTNVSVFNNDANYQTHTQVTNLIQGELANFERWDYKIVTTLPATGEAGLRYLIKNASNTYEEWIYVDNQFWDIGSTGFSGPFVIPVNPSSEPTAQGAVWITT